MEEFSSGEARWMMVGQVLEKYIDRFNNVASVLYFVRATDFNGLTSLSAALSQVLQTVSMVTFLDQTVHVDVEPVRVRNVPGGTFRRRLVVYCEGELDPVQGRRFMYKVFVIDPDPGMLDGKGLRLDTNSALGRLFVDGFLAFTSDIRGNPFSRVVGSEVIQF